MWLRRFYNEDGSGGGAGGEKLDPAELAALRKFKADTEAAQAKIADEQRKAAEAEAKKRGEHEQLLKAKDDELGAATERLKALEARETARLDAVAKRNKERIKGLPEKFQGIVPEGLDADATASFLDKLGEAVGTEEVVVGARRAAGKVGVNIPPACRAEFDRYGAHLGGTVEDWYEQNWKPRQKRTAAEA